MADDLVSVFTANGQPEAQTILMLLNSAGIPAEPVQESYGKTLGLTVGVLGAVEILVPLEFADQAKSLLEAFERGDLEKGTPEADQI
jgi:hypothetical protein